MDFGNKLKELRLQAGLTQKQLADLIGVTKSVISFYERQERTPSPDVLKKLAAVFHVSTDFLLDIDKVKGIIYCRFQGSSEKEYISGTGLIMPSI